MKAPKIDVVIPAQNEEAALPHVIEEIDRGPLRRIVVVDNASTDRTAEIAQALDCVVVSCPRPGYGSACLAGLAYLAEDPPDIVVFLDGDRSDHPKFMAGLISPIAADQYDFVIGSRVKGHAEKGSLNATQVFGNALATRLIKLFWGFQYSDLGPFRAIRWDLLQRLEMRDQNFGWTIEMQIKAGLHGLRVLETPVDYRRRIGVSKISGTISGCVKAGYKILYTIFKLRWFTLFTAGKPAPRGVNP